VGPNLSASANLKALPYGSLGHYNVSVRFALVAAQAAGSRLFEVRNTGANLIVPTRLRVHWLQTGAHTAVIEDSLDMFKVTGFTAVDTTNTVTPVPSTKRLGMAAAPGGAAIRHVTVAGAAAGMTGGTLVKDAAASESVPILFQATLPTTGMNIAFDDFLAHPGQHHPFVFSQNEGLTIENRVLLGAAAGSSVYVHFAWAEVPNY
jgi:hypothetical protein